MASHTPIRMLRLTENPLATPANLDPAYVSRVHAMLDAFVTARVINSRLMIHERANEPLAYAVLSWAIGRCPIEVCLTTSHGRTYESWGLTLDGDVSITVFPLDRPLYSIEPDLQSKIERIRRDADARIAALLNESQPQAVS